MSILVFKGGPLDGEVRDSCGASAFHECHIAPRTDFTDQDFLPDPDAPIPVIRGRYFRDGRDALDRFIYRYDYEHHNRSLAEL